MIAGHKAIFLSGGGAITTPVGFSRDDAYGFGAQDVSTWEYTATGGETSVTYSLNGSGDNVSGCIIGVGPGLSFAGFSNNGSGTTTSQSSDFQLRPGSSVTASGASVIVSIATVATTATYSSANRLRSYGPHGKILREGGNQPGSNTQFVFQCGISDVTATSKYPASQSAGHYFTTTEWLASGTCFITQVLFADSSGVQTVPPGPNLIVDENLLPGCDENNYFLGTNSTSAHTCGYTDACSYLPGDTVNFKVFSEDTGLGQVEIYRRGFYGRETFGARNVLGNGDGYIAITPTVQSSPTVDSTTGATSCSWTTNASWTVPANATPGLYYVVYRRTDTTGFSSGHFVVRASSVSSKHVIVIPDIGSHQPYNVWGDPTNHGDRATGVWTGLDLYQDGLDGALANFAHRGYAVSFDRPYSTQATQDMTYINDVTVGQICFYEAMGYDITYISDVDLEGHPHLLDSAASVTLSGHLEYITDDGYNAIRNAKAAGVNIICLSANTFLWRVFFDPTDTLHRIIICYKDSGTLDISAGAIGSGFSPGDSLGNPQWTGTWRDSRTLGGAGNLDIRRENSTLGQMFTVSGPTLNPAIVDQVYQNSPAFRGSGSILALTSGGSYSTSTNASGYELDSRDGSIGEIPNIVDIWRHTFTALHNVTNDAGSTYSGIADVPVGYTLARDDSSEALILCSGAWRCMWPCTGWQSGAPTGTTKDLDWQNFWLCMLYDMGLVPHTLQSMRPGEDPDVVDPSIGAPGPGRTQVALAYGLTVATQTINLVGISSTESLGAATTQPGTVTFTVTGIVSTERFGSGALTTNAVANPPGIPSAVSSGNATCTSVTTIGSQGIASEAVFGSQGISLSTSITPKGIDFSSVPSSITLEVIIQPVHIDSSEATGEPSVVNTNTVPVLGAASDVRSGSFNISTSSTANPPGISPGERFGIPTSSTTVTANPNGLASDSGSGDLQVTTSATSQPAGVGSSGSTGNFSVGTTITAFPEAGTSQEALGSLQVQPGSITTSVASVAGSSATGSASVSIGVASVQLAGLISNEQVGNSSITTTIGASVNSVPTSAEVGTVSVSNSITVSSGSVASDSRTGSPVVGTTVGALAMGIASQENFGSVSVSSNIFTSIGQGVPTASSTGSILAAQGPVSFNPVGIGSDASTGSPSASPGSITVSVGGISSAEQLGTVQALVIGVTISPVGVASSGNTGPVLGVSGSIVVSINGTDIPAQFGSFATQVASTIAPTGISSSQSSGSLTTGRVGSVESVSSAEATGSPSVHAMTATISPASISSSVIVGNSRIALTLTFVRIQVGDPVLLFSSQDPTLSYVAEPKLLWEASL